MLQEAELNSKKIYVLGDSHTRAFAFHSSFLPFFVGEGRTTCFITPEIKELTQRKVMSCIQHIDPQATVMLVLSEPDIRLYLEDHQGARTSSNLSAEEYIQSCARRYCEMIEVVRDSFEGDLIIYNSVPTPRIAHNNLAYLHNRTVENFCKDNDLIFIDIWEKIVDEDGLVNPKYSAEHIHLNGETTYFVLQELIERKILDASVSLKNNFQWSYMYRFPTGTHDSIRIWGDAKLDMQSVKFARTAVVKQAASALNMLIKNISPSPSILVLGCKEGYIPFNLNQVKSQGIVGIEDDAEKVEMGNFLKRFTNRDDIDFKCQSIHQCIQELDRFDVVIYFANGQDKELKYVTETSHQLSQKAFFVLADDDANLKPSLLENFGRVWSIKIQEETRGTKYAERLFCGFKSNQLSVRLRLSAWIYIFKLRLKQWSLKGYRKVMSILR